MLYCHPLEVFDKRFFSVRNVRVVLYVFVARVQLDGFTRFALIEHQVIEGLCVSFISIRIFSHQRIVGFGASP
jgi:hypothetical protein